MAVGKPYGVAVVGGLLASSCCVVQLLLNALSFGCAGFNTVLEPYRPVLFWLAMGGLGAGFIFDILLPCCGLSSSSSCSAKASSPKTTAATKCEATGNKRAPAFRRFFLMATLVLLLSYSPELLDALHRHPTSPLAPLLRHTSLAWTSATTKTCSDARMLDESEPKTRIFIEVEGMHCSACVAKARSVLHDLNLCARVLLDRAGSGNITVHAEDAEEVFSDERIVSAFERGTHFHVKVLRREALRSAIPLSGDGSHTTEGSFYWLVSSLASLVSR
ncbi:Mercuric transport protein MerT [Balamuthia mandrillaris]